MLSRSAPVTLLILASAVAVAGCTTKSTDTDTPIQTSSNGAGGDDGGGGFGGVDPTGTGGEDGTGGFGGSSGTGEGGGLADACGVDGACWGDEATSCAPTACEAAEINFDCPATGEPTLAYSTCNLTSAIYRENVWAHVVDCVREAGADIVSQCDEGEATVSACIEEAYGNACLNEPADTLCSDAATACGAADPFPLEQCQADLVVMNDDALDAYFECFNDETIVGSCEEIHDICFVQLITL